MVDLYTQLITDVNFIVEAVERGEIAGYTQLPPKAVHAEKTNSAAKAGNAMSVRSAKSATNVNSVSIGKTVINKELPFVHKYTAGSGLEGSIDIRLDPGVYIAIFQRTSYSSTSNVPTSYTTHCGVLTVIENKNTYCRIAARNDGSGSTLFYEPSMNRIRFYRYYTYAGGGGVQGVAPTRTSAEIHIYKIGTLKEEV